MTTNDTVKVNFSWFEGQLWTISGWNSKTIAVLINQANPAEFLKAHISNITVVERPVK